MEETDFPTQFSGEIKLQTFSSGGNKLKQGGLNCNFDAVDFKEYGHDDEYYHVYAYLNGAIVTDFYLPKPLKRRFVVEMNRTVE